MDKTYYTVYKITNKINGKIYIGCHKTKNLNDGYMGSGKYLRISQKKYGLENFEKEILFIFETPEEMYAKELELVNDDFLLDEKTYNLVIGGRGGFNFTSHIFTERFRLKFLELRNDPVWVKNTSTAISSGIRGYYKNGGKNPFFGKTHTEETKKKMSKIRREGDRNSQHGTMWITDEVNNKKVKMGEIIPEGWRKGRKVKSLQGSIWVTNEIENKVLKENESIPDGWRRGRMGVKQRMWITDGTNNNLIKNDENIPDGWYKGRNCKSTF